MKTVYLDGSAGTTGLLIRERLARRPDLQLLSLPENWRKDREKRREALNACDVAILCLPEAAAREAAQLVQNPQVRLIDASPAHRTEAGWTYGFPELSADGRERLAGAHRVSVPGCHASGFLALVRPLVLAGILKPEVGLTCLSLTGYSGGGKAMIADYENPARPANRIAPRQYGLTQRHKHLPEMQYFSGLCQPPVFMPVVADYPRGLLVSVPLTKDTLQPGCDISDIRDCLLATYGGPVVRFVDHMDEEGFLAAARLAGSDAMEVAVYGGSERFLLAASYDNLGKGASGAAIQCLNLMLGAEETLSMQLAIQEEEP